MWSRTIYFRRENLTSNADLCLSSDILQRGSGSTPGPPGEVGLRSHINTRCPQTHPELTGTKRDTWSMLAQLELKMLRPSQSTTAGGGGHYGRLYGAVRKLVRRKACPKKIQPQSRWTEESWDRDHTTQTKRRDNRATWQFPYSSGK